MVIIIEIKLIKIKTTAFGKIEIVNSDRGCLSKKFQITEHVFCYRFCVSFNKFIPVELAMDLSQNYIFRQKCIEF